MFMLAASLLDYVVLSNWISGGVSPELLMYIGDIGILIINLVSAAWVVVKTVEQAISFTEGFYYMYGNGSAFGNLMGGVELAFIILYLMTSLAITVMAIVGAMFMWEMISGREYAALNEGKFGHAFSWPDIIKYGALGMILAFGTWTTAWAIGQTVDNTVGWFDDWMDATTSKTEGTDKRNGRVDPAGTSVQFDYLYHSISSFYAWFTDITIMVGAWLFAYYFMSSGMGPLRGCDLAEVDESYYTDVRTLIASQTDLETCKKSVYKIFKLADLDKSGMVDRCENAKFIYGLGNTQEYALNYNMIITLPYLYSYCTHTFP